MNELSRADVLTGRVLGITLADFGLDDRVEIEMRLAMSPKSSKPQTKSE